MHPYQVYKYTVDYILAISHYILSQVSPNLMAVPKPILLHLKRKPRRTYSKKLTHIKTSIFESKGQSTLVMTFAELYGIYLIIIANEREFYELQVIQIVGHRVNCA